MTRAAKLRLAARVAPDRNHVTATNRAFDNPIVARLESVDGSGPRRAQCRRQSASADHRAYIDDYKLLLIATLAILPLLIVFKKAPADAADGRGMMME